MHEMSLMESVVEIACETARANDAHAIRSIRLDVGVLSHVDPDSLAFCYEAINSNLAHLARDYKGQIPAHETAARTRNSLLTASIDQVMERGLHEYLEEFIIANDKLVLRPKTLSIQ